MAEPAKAASSRRGGPRVSVRIGQVKGADGKNRVVYSYMKKSVADLFKLKAEQPTKKIKRGNKTIVVKLRGVRTNSIKVPIGTKTVGTGKKARKVYRYAAIPVGPLPLTQTDAFVKKLTNKPTFYVSPDGRTQSVVQSGTK